MGTKVQNIKSNRPKRQKAFHEMTFIEKVACKAECSTRAVRYVLAGQRGHKTLLANKILLTAAIIEERENKLLKEIIRVVNF